jgi:Protein of unknown function (DUF3309)
MEFVNVNSLRTHVSGYEPGETIARQQNCGNLAAGFAYGLGQSKVGGPNMSLLLILLLIILLFGSVGTYPRWGYSSGWGYGPSGLLGLILLIVLIMALLGRSPV